MSALGGSSTYRVLDSQAPRQAADPIVANIAQRIRTAAETTTPRDTGHYAGSWTAERLKPGIWLVANDVAYNMYVEYGTRHMPARPTFGRVMAAYRAQVGR